jgi:hypothetical protein
LAFRPPELEVPGISAALVDHDPAAAAPSKAELVFHGP